VSTDPARLDGMVAIVTGTSPNIGGAFAAGLAAAGAKVVCTDISAETAEACAKAITAAGGSAVAVAGDVTDPEHADEAVARAVELGGKVDVLVNNAVWFNQKGLLTMPLPEYRRQLDIILTGPFLFTRAAARVMIEKGTGGSVVNVLSTAAWQGQPGNIGYSTGKSGLINFTRSAAMELAEHGIRVNGLTPTATAIDDPDIAGRMAAAKDPSLRYPMDFAGQAPWGKLPTPQDYVPALVFLASADSKFVNATNITVDGGVTAKYWPWRPDLGRVAEDAWTP